MTKKTFLMAASAFLLMVLTASTASAYAIIINETRYGIAGHTYTFTAYLHAGAKYHADLRAPGAYHCGQWRPDMDLYVVNPYGQTYRFTRYGNESVDFTALHTGTYRFYAMPLYGNGTFRFHLGMKNMYLSAH